LQQKSSIQIQTKLILVTVIEKGKIKHIIKTFLGLTSHFTHEKKIIEKNWGKILLLKARFFHTKNLV